MIEIDFCQSDFGLASGAQPGQHGVLGAPQSQIVPERGLQLPLRAGCCCWPSNDWIDDAAGHLTIRFTPETETPSGALVQAWGQYQALIRVLPERLEANLYGEVVALAVRWQANVVHTVTLDWDCRSGATISLGANGAARQTRRRRLSWQAFRQKYVPFSVGGLAAGKRLSTWSGELAGWVRSATVGRTPMTVPGPVATAKSGAALASPIPAVAGVAIVAVDDPPISPDPLQLKMLPDRLDDLRRTRDVAGLDEVLGLARNEREELSLLTWWVGQLWPHCNYWPWEASRQRDIFWRRGHEMLPQIQAGEMGGMCGGYAHVMEELCWALGKDARRIQAAGHSSFEVWCNEANAWIIADASHGRASHLFGDADGSLLGADALIRRAEALSWNPQALDDVMVLACDHENLVPRPELHRQMTAPYDRVGLNIDKDHDVEAPIHAWYLQAADRAYYRDDGMNCGPSNLLLDELAPLYPARNRVRVQGRWTTPGRQLQLQFEAVGVRFFETFLISIDGAAEETCGETVDWVLHGGVNDLSVRTRNQLGTRGRAFGLALWCR